MADYKQLTRYTTPVGTMHYPYIHKPNQFGNYEVKFELSAQDAAELIGLIKTETKLQAKEHPLKDAEGNIRYANPPYEKVGEVVTFKAKQTATVTNKKTGKVNTFTVAIYDKNKKELDPDTISPGTGTRGKLGLELNPYTTTLAGVGVSLRLRAVQITDYVEYVQRVDPATEFGFDTEQGTDCTPADNSNPVDDSDLPF